MRLRISILLIINTFCSLTSFSQDKSNRGKEFWLAYGFDYSFFNESPVNEQELAIYISTEAAATVTVTITNTGYTQTLNIPANTVDATIIIPKSGPNDARTLTDGLQNRGIHILSDTAIAAYAHVYATMVSGATMLMPVETYGYNYFSINYTQTTSGSQLPAINPNTQNGPDWYSWFYVIASEDNTRLDITPSDTTKNGWLPNNTYTINLNKGESYHVFGKLIGSSSQAWAASKDMTGSKVLSIPGADGNCHPVAVFSGSGGIRICRGDGGEFVHQQVFPSQAWGTRYLTYHTINNTNTDILETNRNYYRICVQDPATVVRKNGIVMTGLVNNFYYEYQDSTGGDYIESNNPILVAQYMVNENQCWNFPVTFPGPPSYGDPEMFYISPIEQGQKAVRFYTPRKSGIDYVYANIHVPTAAVSSLRVDGAVVPASQIIPHPNLPSYSVALRRFTGPAAQHTITCDSAFTSTVYGLGNYESYGYNVGTLINNLNNYTGIQNTLNTNGLVDTFTCPKTPFRLIAKLAYPATQIHWKLSQVAGISPNTDSIIISPVSIGTEIINGRTYYLYTLQQDFTFANSGTFYIPISYSATVIENCNQTEFATLKVIVKPGPVADFSFNSPACLSDTVHFTGTSIPGIFNLVNYNWLFADNSTASGVDTVKLFTTAGSQNVKYTIIADNGCLHDTTKVITVFERPTAAFSINGNVCTKDSVLITDNSSIAAGTITNWQWDFGDGTNATFTNNNPFHHIYTTPGNYIISLITNSNNNCKSDTSFVPVTVNARPTATFAYSGNICLGDSVLFSDNSIPNIGNITTWQWNFGDGNSAIKANSNPFYYTYGSSGNFPVTLVVTGSNTCVSDTFRLTVNVSSQPSATFIISGKPCIDSVQSFTSSLSAGGSNPPTFNWNFGDGQSFSSATSNSTTHAYSALQSNVIVRHWISYSGGCSSDTTFNNIPVINANPVANFTLDQTILCEKKSIEFTSTSTGVSTWNWNFGNGTGSNVPPFGRSYNVPGSYTISLNVKTADGCGSLTFTQPVVINSTPVVDAGPDKLIRFGTSTTLDATISNSANYNFLWTPSLFLNNAAILNPVSTPDVPVTYIIQAIDKITGCISTDGVLITPVSDIFIPTGFTPNNDGRNDKWVIPGLALYPEAQVTVFNRWGQKIYETKGYYSNPWNGYYKGVAQPSDVYIYMIQLNDEKKQFFKGTFTLIR